MDSESTTILLKKMAKPLAKKVETLDLDDVDVRGTMPFVTLKQTMLMELNLQAMMSQTLEMILPQVIMKCKWWQLLCPLNEVFQHLM